MHNADEDKKVPLGKTKTPASEKDLPESLAGIDIQSGLERLTGNTKLYRKLLIAFEKKYATVSDEIREEIQKGDLQKAEFLAHNVKGVAGNISADSVFVAADKLEMGIKQKDTDAYDALLSEFDQALKPVLQGIKNFDQPEEKTPTLS